MDMNFEYYKVFYYVAKCGSITQAAEELQNNQPNISRMVKLLEHNLRCRLLVRTNRGISLTPEGERLYAHVRIAVEQLQKAEEELLSLVMFKDGVITIGVSETALHMVLPALNAYKKAYPQIRIRLQNHLTGEAVESVRNGLVDFSIVTTPAMISRPLKATILMECRDILVAGPAFRAIRQPISLAELSALPLICLSEGTMTYQLYSEFYQEHHVRLKPELEAATADQILPMVKNNLGVAFLPEVYASEALNQQEVYHLHLKEEIPERHICLVENENAPLSLAAGEFKNILMGYQYVCPQDAL